MNKPVLLSVLIVASLGFISCGGGSVVPKPPSGLTERVFASQSVSGPASQGGLVIINGQYDILPRAGEISAGSSPGLMAISPSRSTVLAFDSSTNSVNVVNTIKETTTGAISLPGPTTSMVALDNGFGYVPVPSAPIVGASPGAVEVLNLASGGTTATIPLPAAQTVVASPNGSQILVFSNDSNNVTVIYPLLVNTGVPVTTTVSGFDQPVYAVFSSDGTTAYVLNCGPQCGSSSASASVEVLNMATLATGPSVAVDAATIGLINGTNLYVAGTSPTNNKCNPQTTSAAVCGRLDTIDLGSMTVTGSAMITDGYHDRIDISANLQLYIGSHTCTNIGNVNNISGEVRGCLSIFNTTNGNVIIPPDNGDVTGLQSFTTRFVMYVAEGGNLRVYDTDLNSLLLNDYITTGTIVIRGQVIDVKAVDFF